MARQPSAAALGETQNGLWHLTVLLSDRLNPKSGRGYNLSTSIMDENQPKPEAGSDPEWEEVRKKTPGLEEDPGEADEAKAGADAKAQAEKEEADKKAADEAAEAEADAEVGEEGDEDADDEDPTPRRPERYIPIAKYTSEKKQWKESEAAKDARIAELEKLAAQGQNASHDAAVKKYAEKHGVTEDEAREEVKELQTILGIEPGEKKPANTTEKPELDEEQKQILEKAEQTLAEKAYDQEFSSAAVPEIKKHFPDATPEQLKEAKTELEKISCTKEFIDKSLDYVVFKSLSGLQSIFKSTPQSPESQRQGANRDTPKLRSDDFKDGKTAFSKLSELPAEEQSKIIEGMDIPTYERYVRYLEDNTPLEINRGGRRVRF